MTERIRRLYMKMIGFDRGAPGLIQHFTKVHAYSALIAEEEGLPSELREALEAAALVHDIAIPLCIEKYGSDAGDLQQREGPALARDLLSSLGFDDAVIERVCWLVAHHHTYHPIDGADHQILVEADFLVNAFEGGHSEETRRNTLERIFKTRTGIEIYRMMYSL